MKKDSFIRLKQGLRKLDKDEYFEVVEKAWPKLEPWQKENIRFDFFILNMFPLLAKKKEIYLVLFQCWISRAFWKDNGDERLPPPDYIDELNFFADVKPGDLFIERDG